MVVNAEAATPEVSGSVLDMYAKEVIAQNERATIYGKVVLKKVVPEFAEYQDESGEVHLMRYSSSTAETRSGVGHLFQETVFWDNPERSKDIAYHMGIISNSVLHMVSLSVLEVGPALRSPHEFLKNHAQAVQPEVPLANAV